MSNIVDTLAGLVLTYGFNVLGAVGTLVLGYIGAKLVTNLVKRTMKRSEIDDTLINFVGDLIYYGLLAFTVVAALNTLGIATASFVAVIGAAGLAVGLALQGALANFAAGVMVILFHPYKVGDLVEVNGQLGVVQNVAIFSTVLATPDNKKVIVPNGAALGGNIVNYTANGKIRVDLTFGIGYEDDIRKAKTIFQAILDEHDKVLAEPAPAVTVAELGDSSVNFAVRPFVKPEHYWDVYFDVTEAVKLRLDEAGISIPFPQRDVHLYQS